jgi:hypothetical protein
MSTFNNGDTLLSIRAKLNRMLGQNLYAFDYGAIPYATRALAVAGTDSTSAIQAAIDAWLAGGGIGKVQFDPGYYLVGGALSQARGGNAQIALPVVASSSPKLSLCLYCPVPAAAESYGSAASAAGAILVSTLTGASYDATHFIPSVIGGPTTNQASPAVSAFTNIYVTVDGIAINLPDNPTVSAFDFECVASCNMKDFRVETATGTISSVVQPTAPSAAALIMPKNDNNVINTVGNGSIIGCYVGIATGEHTQLKGTVQIFRCYIGTAPMAPTYHPSLIGGLLSIEHCPYVLAGWDPTAGVTDIPADYVVSYEFVDIEDAASGSWYSPISHVKDLNNHLKGHFRYGRVLAGVGYTTAALTTTGCANLLLKDISLT